MKGNNLLSGPSERSLQDDNVTKQYEIMEKNTVNEEKENCQNCDARFSPCGDYVTLCNRCRYELLGVR